MRANTYPRFFDQQASNMPYTEWSALDTRQRGMTIYVNASCSCTGIHRRAWQQTREATCESNKRHVCCDVRGSKKSSLHMYIVWYAILPYIHAERLYMGIFSAIYEHPYTGKTSHQYTTACSQLHVNHLTIHCLESSPCQMGEASCCVRQIGVVEGIQHAVCAIILVSDTYQTGVR